jgi:hypothetical protein
MAWNPDSSVSQITGKYNIKFVELLQHFSIIYNVKPFYSLVKSPLCSCSSHTTPLMATEMLKIITRREKIINLGP